MAEKWEIQWEFVRIPIVSSQELGNNKGELSWLPG